MVICLYILRTVVGALGLFDFSLIDAAALGCNTRQPSCAFWFRPGTAFLTSGMFAFLASMDNYPISIFFTDAWTKTADPDAAVCRGAARPDHRRNFPPAFVLPPSSPS